MALCGDTGHLIYLLLFFFEDKKLLGLTLLSPFSHLSVYPSDQT